MLSDSPLTIAYDRNARQMVDWRELVFPELKEFDEPQRERMLREARANEFDWLERILMPF
jgi:hypothetical protein